MTIAICDGCPGPGYWERDNSHYPTPMSLYLWNLFVPAHDKGRRMGLDRYGCVLEGLDFALVKGRLYTRARPVESAAELERRGRIAEEALAAKLWRRDRAAWREIGHSFRCRLLAFARQDPSCLDSNALHDQLIALRDIFVEGVIQHFDQQPASMFVVGDWVRRTCEWTGAATSEVLAVLRNSSCESADYLRAISRLAESLRSNPAASAFVREHAADPGVQIEELRKISPEIRKALDAYLDEYADRIVTGFDITDSTLRELPQFIMSIIASQLDSTRHPAADVNVLGAEEKLCSLVPSQHRSEFDEGLQEARSAYGLHDEDVRITYLWPLGLIRRAVLVAADRLVSRGGLRSACDVFQLAPDELHRLLLGGSCPTAEEISQRSAQWRDWAHDEPPAAYGERELGLPEHLLTPAAARVSAAFNFYLAEMEARAKPSPQGSWSVLVEGLAASPGRYEGKARIVRGPADFGKLLRGDVLVARTTSPAFSIILPIIGGVVTDRGGALCHAAIVAREFGIPAVVGTNQGTAKIPDGAQVLVDGDRGFVTVRL